MALKRWRIAFIMKKYVKKIADSYREKRERRGIERVEAAEACDI